MCWLSPAWRDGFRSNVRKCNSEIQLELCRFQMASLHLTLTRIWLAAEKWNCNISSSTILPSVRSAHCHHHPVWSLPCFIFSIWNKEFKDTWFHQEKLHAFPSSCLFSWWPTTLLITDPCRNRKAGGFVLCCFYICSCPVVFSLLEKVRHLPQQFSTLPAAFLFSWLQAVWPSKLTGVR